MAYKLGTKIRVTCTVDNMKLKKATCTCFIVPEIRPVATKLIFWVNIVNNVRNLIQCH